MFARTGDPSASDALLEQLLAAFDLIAAFPGLGAQRNHVRRGLRSHLAGNHLVFYRPHRDFVEIVRVIHQRRDLRRAFAKKRHKVTLTADFEQFVRDRVDSGEYASVEAVLSACMDALAEREAVEHDLALWQEQVKLAEEQFELAEYRDEVEVRDRLPGDE